MRVSSSARLALVAAALVACRGAPPPQADESSVAPPPETRDGLLLAAAKAALPPAGIAPADLPDPESRGAQYLAQYCTACHSLPSPMIHSATDWPAVLRRMWLRMDLLPRQFNVPLPTAGERAGMLQYVLDNALQVSGASLPAGPGRSEFAETCSQCHALPDPTQHSPADWAAVMMRMERNVEQMLVGELPPDRFSTILAYLQRASEGPPRSPGGD